METHVQCHAPVNAPSKTGLYSVDTECDHCDGDEATFDRPTLLLITDYVFLALAERCWQMSSSFVEICSGTYNVRQK